MLGLVLLASLWSGAARAANGTETGDSLTISLLTMGPGEHPFTKFGHSAIWVHDAATGRDEIYNYGTFAFDSPTLFLDSARGTLPYWLSVQSLAGTLRSYEKAQRSLLASELELTPAQRAALHAALLENEKPEHRFYRYDFYRDNCATRVRDVIDRVLGGQIHARAHAPAKLSFRGHTLRLVADDGWLYAALGLAIGRGTDSPITFWDEGFLPARLHDLLLNTNVTRDGKQLPLVRSEHMLLPAAHFLARAWPPDWVGRYFRSGLALAALFAALGLGAHYGTRLRGVLSVAYMVLGLLLGVLGCALGYLTFMSSHFAAAANYNVLLAPPWLLVLVAIGPSMARGRPWAWRVARWLMNLTVCSTAVAVAAHAVQSFPQQNWSELAFAVPLWLGASAAAALTQTSMASRWVRPERDTE
ncbi:MAG: DUF4105 domain-containing protein [Pseudomonadota bacterium]